MRQTRTADRSHGLVPLAEFHRAIVEDRRVVLLSEKVTVSSLFTLISLSNTACHVTHGKTIIRELR